jgi:hypothetical protein
MATPTVVFVETVALSGPFGWFFIGAPPQSGLTRAYGIIGDCSGSKFLAGPPRLNEIN